jgi:hypothetical protein
MHWNELAQGNPVIRCSEHIIFSVKPQFSVPAFSEFPYLVNILSGPSQSLIYTMYYFPIFSESQFSE